MSVLICGSSKQTVLKDTLHLPTSTRLGIRPPTPLGARRGRLDPCACRQLAEYFYRIVHAYARNHGSEAFSTKTSRQVGIVVWHRAGVGTKQGPSDKIVELEVDVSQYDDHGLRHLGSRVDD